MRAATAASAAATAPKHVLQTPPTPPALRRVPARFHHLAQQPHVRQVVQQLLRLDRRSKEVKHRVFGILPLALLLHHRHRALAAARQHAPEGQALLQRRIRQRTAHLRGNRVNASDETVAACSAHKGVGVAAAEGAAAGVRRRRQLVGGAAVLLCVHMCRPSGLGAVMDDLVACSKG